jgi:hypothetical protein
MRLPVAVACLLAAFFGTASAAPNVAGTVDFVEGDVRVLKADKSVAQPKVGDPVYETDAIATGTDGEVHFKMEDGGFLAVRPNTKMRIVQFQANGESTDRSVLGVLEGSLRAISGWIGRYNAKSYEIRARGSTIGIRGTDHETHVRLKDDAEGEAGVYDRVFEGGTFIRTGQGRVDVAPGKAGFWSEKARGRPRVLDKVPAFFRGTRNEGRLEGLHGRLQPLLEKHREDRRVHLREKAAAAKKAGGVRAEHPMPREKALATHERAKAASEKGAPSEAKDHARMLRDKSAEARERAKAAKEGKAHRPANGGKEGSPPGS